MPLLSLPCHNWCHSADSLSVILIRLLKSAIALSLSRAEIKIKNWEKNPDCYRARKISFISVVCMNILNMWETIIISISIWVIISFQDVLCELSAKLFEVFCVHLQGCRSRHISGPYHISSIKSFIDWSKRLLREWEYWSSMAHRLVGHRKKSE